MLSAWMKNLKISLFKLVGAEQPLPPDVMPVF